MSIAILLFAFASISNAQPAQFNVLVLDALDGRPQPNVEVEFLCIGPPRNFAAQSAFTNDKGLVALPYVCDDGQKIQLEVFPPHGKEQCGDDVETSFEAVMKKGLVSDSTSTGGMGGMWCPNRVSRTLTPVPGMVTVLVKKPTWWQSHIAG